MEDRKCRIGPPGEIGDDKFNSEDFAADDLNGRKAMPAAGPCPVTVKDTSARWAEVGAPGGVRRLNVTVPKRHRAFCPIRGLCHARQTDGDDGVSSVSSYR